MGKKYFYLVCLLGLLSCSGPSVNQNRFVANEASVNCSDLARDVITAFREPVVTIEGDPILKKVDYVNLINSVDDLRGSLESASDVPIHILKPRIESSFTNHESPVVNLSSLFAKYASGKGNHPKYSLAILSHEYGHAIFDKNINIQSPVWKEMDKKVRDISELTNKTQSDFFTSKTILREAKTSEEKILAQEMADNASENLKNLSTILKQRMTMKTIQRSYHEFFADSVAVVTFQDPRIMYKSLVGDGVEKASGEVVKNRQEFIRINFENRQFDRSWGASHWKQWENDMHNSLKNGSDFNPYLFFAPARSAFWSVVESRAKNPLQQKEILTDLFSILKIHYETNIDQLSSIETIDAFKLNESLIRLFQEKWP